MAFIVRKAELSADGVACLLSERSAGAVIPNIREPRPTGFPLLFDSSCRLIEPAVLYLHEHYVQGVGSLETLRTYSEQLYDWFDALDQNDIKWEEASVVDLIAYRNRMRFEESGHTGRPYAPSTINHRVRGVVRFYKWCVSNSWLKYSEIASDQRKAGKLPPHIVSRYGVNYEERSIFVFRQYKEQPRPLTTAQCRELLSRLPSPFDLMARWQLYSGLRIAELLKLTVGDVEETSLDNDEHKYIAIIRKGNKRGTIVASRSLLRETQHYIAVERFAMMKRAKRKSRYRPTQSLFLTSRGGPPGRNWYQRLIARTARECGFRATSHTLRATFACLMLARLTELARQGEAINPLLIVQNLMGHEHMDTTDRYLRAVDVDESSLVDAIATVAALER